jgi:nickel-dependent lactate racemase
MRARFRCGTDELELSVPDGAIVYASRYPKPMSSAAGAVLEAARRPVGAPSLREAVARRRPGQVVVVVSDITRPVPYTEFLPALLAELRAGGVSADEMLILIATGMHRPTTAPEKERMLAAAAGACRVVDHRADDEDGLVELPGRSRAGSRVRLNRQYVEAGFRLTTGLVEPHFMAGFSGGRKSVCPGLASLETVRHFHGSAFMGDARARNACLDGNPCHEEALSVARLAPPDFTLDVALDPQRRVVRAFGGEMEAAHAAACRFVRECACPQVQREADVVVTSSGGHPLDATFYQCVKGFVSCLPAVREGGAVLAFGGCAEGIGSADYEGLMKRYAGRWRQFLEDVREPGFFVRDQWQFQLHARALTKVGQERLHFVTDGLPTEELSQLSVTGHAVAPGRVAEAAQALLSELTRDGATVAVLPEGPYCAPVSPEPEATPVPFATP